MSSFGQVYLEETEIQIPKETAFALQSKSKDFSATVRLGNAKLNLVADEHNSSVDWYSSAIIYCDTQTLATLVKSDAMVRWALVHVPRTGPIFQSKIQKRASCDMPTIISQNTWRTGLPDPTPGRNSTPTKHCIVHHSAANSGDTNYTQIVRSIYTYHTQSNGWDDIGYNYLIAGNGAIYAGRDPEKVGIEQDNVQGAHFCGKNANTMGVCLIGDLQTNPPTDTQVTSLTKLIQWKVKKTGLAPLRFEAHPGDTDPLLAVIAGHRDGCNTACPGDKLYAKLGQLRHDANECSPFLGVKELGGISDLRFTYTDSKLKITSEKIIDLWEVYSLSGRLIHRSQNDYIIITQSGIHVLHYSVNGVHEVRLFSL